MPPPTKGVCLVRLLSGVVIERTVADRPVRRLLAPLGSASSQSSPPSLDQYTELPGSNGLVL
jgi:hypothetical protein